MTYMSEGIVCKVWNISGNSSLRSSKANISDSIAYILNAEKTETVLLNENEAAFNSKQLQRECQYVVDDIKTVAGAYVGSNNLSTSDIQKAVVEMMSVKNFYNKTDGRAALHGVISLPVDESKKANAADLLSLCSDVMQELFPNNQAIFAVHTNTDNLHVHFIVNSVGLDGKKIHQPKYYIRDVLHPCVNKFALSYGFTQNEEWKNSKTVDKYTFADIKIKLRNAIDYSIENAETFDEFIEILNSQNIDIKIGKHFSLKIEEAGKSIRSYQLGDAYTKDSIIERLQIKKQELSLNHVGEYVLKEQIDDVFDPRLVTLKKYKDLGREEQISVIKNLKIGINPWKINRDNNWHLVSISNDLNMTNRINKYVSFYSEDGSVESALNQIVNIKKTIATEKKELKKVYSLYKPMLVLYEDMKIFERKAYLYEYKNAHEYKAEFEQYQDLTRRLKNNYGKSIGEVKEFIDNYNNELTYANAQLEELSCEYREIKKYYASRGGTLSNSLYEILNVSEANSSAGKGIFEANVSYVVSTNDENHLLRIVKTPYVDEKGVARENISVSVISKNGNILKTCDLKDGKKEFIEFIKTFEKDVNFTDCRTFKNYNVANSYRKNVSKSSGESKDDFLNLSSHSDVCTIFKAVNMGIVYGDAPFIFSNQGNSDYFGEVSKNANGLNIRILNKKNECVETFSVPFYQERNNKGFNTLVDIKNKYAFSDSIKTFQNLAEANAYYKSSALSHRETK